MDAASGSEGTVGTSGTETSWAPGTCRSVDVDFVEEDPRRDEDRNVGSLEDLLAQLEEQDEQQGSKVRESLDLGGSWRLESVEDLLETLRGKGSTILERGSGGRGRKRPPEIKKSQPFCRFAQVGLFIRKRDQKLFRSEENGGFDPIFWLGSV